MFCLWLGLIVHPVMKLGRHMEARGWGGAQGVEEERKGLGRSARDWKGAQGVSDEGKGLGRSER